MAESKQKPVAVVTGVGPGLGASLARRFAREYAVALTARSADYLRELAGDIRKAGGVALEVQADVGSREQVAAGFKLIRERLGEVDVLLHNAGAGPFGSISEVTPDQFENCLRVNALGAFMCAKECAPAMIGRGRGVMLFTGATAGVKAGARSAAFGPANFAKRGLAQSLARDLGPKGIHVAWINIDGAIDLPNRSIPHMKKEDMLNPDAIAETYWHLAHQDRSAWTMETEVRPFKEKF
ncbi:MAG TPA: SDR family NAD(P)-dependent oxidoreductase [Candidatus Binataceae bacterium]|jgi:NAD(P)-dependent dehydrogenase (short-subunit alcohol dehydrogenase family)|nr:SDR family NAD(P)-dependent oxidoreductase [Candidatus Binataceae bacterium]